MKAIRRSSSPIYIHIYRITKLLEQLLHELILIYLLIVIMIILNLAIEVWARSNTKLITEISVIVDASLDFGRLFAITLDGAIDPPGGGTEALAQHRPDILVPEPQRRLERNHGVPRHRLGGPQTVEADGLPRRAVVVVPRQLEWPSAVVHLVRVARVLSNSIPVAVVMIRASCLFYVAQNCTQKQNPLLH